MKPLFSCPVAAACLAMLGFAFASVGTADAWTLRTLHSFCAEAKCADGANPLAGLVRDSAGNLYGTTETGGNTRDCNLGCGVAFELSPTGQNWTYSVLHTFCPSCGDGAFPLAALIVDVNGNLYGTTAAGPGNGCGTVFRLSPNAGRTKWKEKILHAFSCDPFGDQATSALTYQGKDSGLPYDGTSPLYGTTVSGGTGAGTVYQIAWNGSRWKHRVIYAFCPNGGDGCTDGKFPGSELILDSSGNLFGMTAFGGSTGNGVVYELKPNASGTKLRESILYNFCQLENCNDGAAPAGALVMDAAGHLFGTSNGPGDIGNIFGLAHRRHGWKETVLHIFNQGKECGYNPEAGLVLDAAGNLYGTASAGGCGQFGFGGTIFEQSGSTFSTLYNFCSLDHCADGNGPQAPLIRDAAGNLYGTTVSFGANGNGGTVFELLP